MRARIFIWRRWAPRCSAPARLPPSGTTGPAISEFDTGLTPNVRLWGISSGPDGNLWFTEETHNAVGRITPGGVITEFTAGFPTGSPQGIVNGPDGNLWVAMAGGNGAIAQVTKAGVVTEFPVPTQGDPTDITVGPTATSGTSTAPPTWSAGSPRTAASPSSHRPDPDSEPSSITKGPDGALWFTEAKAGKIGRITMAGGIAEFSSGLSGSSEPKDIVTGPDGNLWFTLNADPGGIGRITPQGDIVEFSDGLSMNSAPLGIAAGPDGNLWFTESKTPAVGRITTEGEITEYNTGLVSILDPWGISAGPDGNMWFTGNSPGLVGRITLPPLVRHLDADQITTTSARLRGKVRPNSQATEYRFEYGRTEDYGNETGPAYAGSSYSLTTLMATVEGLVPGTEYHFRACREQRRRSQQGTGSRVQDRVAAARRWQSIPRCRRRRRRGARVRRDRRGRAEGQGEGQDIGRRLGDASRRLRAARGRGARHPPGTGPADQRGLPRRHADRNVRRRHLLSAPVALRLRAR